MHNFSLVLLLATLCAFSISSINAQRSAQAFRDKFNANAAPNRADGRGGSPSNNSGNRRNAGGGGMREKYRPPSPSNRPGQAGRTRGGSVKGGGRPKFGDRMQRQKKFYSDIEKHSDVHRGGKYAKVRALMADFYKRGAMRVGKSNRLTFDSVGVAETMIPEDYNDGTELTANAEILGDFIGGDITPTVEQMEELLREVEGGRTKRKVSSTTRRWSTTIPYRFGDNDRTWQSSVLAGIAQWEASTCLRFAANAQGTDYISFIRGSGCYSNVGRTGGQQAISIGDGCEKVGIVSHEIGHALGFWHEQARPDRDSYIRIISGNILAGMSSQFTPQSSIEYQNGDYDLGSVMHYGPKAFTSNWDLRTIDTRDEIYANTIGQREGVSFIDVKQINNIYCGNVCNRRSCLHGGYADPKACSKCRCPDGLGGSDCGSVQSSDGGCGATLTADSQWKSLDGPAVRQSQSCNYKINSPPGTRIELQVSRLNLPCVDTCSTFLEMKTGRNMERTGARLCCDPPTRTMTTEDNMALLLHRSDGVAQAGWRGWAVRYRYLGSPSGTTSRPTTTRYTTRRPTRTTTSGGGSTRGQWGDWGSWERCTKSCGMCGTQKRQRQCYNGGCRGNASKSRACGSRTCDTNKSPRQNSPGSCRGSVRAPCNMIEKFKQTHGTHVSQSMVKMAAQNGLIHVVWDEGDADNDNGDMDRKCTLGRDGVCRGGKGNNGWHRRNKRQQHRGGAVHDDRRGGKGNRRNNNGGWWNHNGNPQRRAPRPQQQNWQGNNNRQRPPARPNSNGNRQGGNTRNSGGGYCNDHFTYDCNRVPSGGGGADREGTCCTGFSPQGNGYCA